MTASGTESSLHHHSVSVIIPVYNGIKFIANAIDSALAQQGDYLREVLVIDDGSSDGTSDFIREHYPYKVRLITKEQNQGASAARNTGIFSAAGDYVAFLDADDVWLDNKLLLQMPVFEQDPDCMVCSAGNIIDLKPEDGNRRRQRKRCGKTKQLSFEHLFEEPFVYTTSIVLPTRLARQINGFNTAFKTAEDIDFVLNIAAKHAVYLINTPLVEYRRRANSLGTATSSYSDHLTVLDQFLHKNPDIQVAKELIIRTKNAIYNRWIEDALHGRRINDFIRILKQMSLTYWNRHTLRLVMKGALISLLAPFISGRQSHNSS